MSHGSGEPWTDIPDYEERVNYAPPDVEYKAREPDWTEFMVGIITIVATAMAALTVTVVTVIIGKIIKGD